MSKPVIITRSALDALNRGWDARFVARLSQHAEETTGSADIREKTRAESVLASLMCDAAQKLKRASAMRLEARLLLEEARELEMDACLLKMK